jgi:hypothetical protein
MKTIISISIVMLFLTVSCKKQSAPYPGTSAPPPLKYTIVDKNGASIFNAALATDSVLFTYPGGQFYDYAFNWSAAQPPAYASYIPLYKKYNDFIVYDAYPMLRLSDSHSPINTFNLNYHGQNLGTVYFKYLREHSNWMEASIFTFNNVPVKLDTTGGGHLYVIQLQQ